MAKVLNFIILALVLVLTPVSAISAGTQSKALHIAVISCGLNPKSHSAVLAELAAKDLKAQGMKVDLIDLRTYKLPLVDGNEGKAYEDPQVKELNDRIEKADAIVIASPIYLNSVAATTKNMAELTTHRHKEIISGRAWKNKVVGFMGASSGKFSLYTFFPFINSLIIDSKIIFVPSFVMATKEDFNDKSEVSATTAERVEGLTKDLVRMTKALKG